MTRHGEAHVQNQVRLAAAGDAGEEHELLTEPVELGAERSRLEGNAAVCTSEDGIEAVEQGTDAATEGRWHGGSMVGARHRASPRQ